MLCFTCAGVGSQRPVSKESTAHINTAIFRNTTQMVLLRLIARDTPAEQKSQALEKELP